jgi:hypothetical protein
MSAPRHLWTGDWRLESSALAEELAARRARGEEPSEPEAPVRPPRRTLRERLLAAWGRHRRRLRVALVVASVTLLGGGVVYAASAALAGGAGQHPVAASGSRPWLGIDVSSSPVGGALVVAVVPGSPAAAAGIEPGDVITDIDTQPVAAPATFISAIAGMEPGDRVDIHLKRGATGYTAHVELGARPEGSP